MSKFKVLTRRVFPVKPRPARDPHALVLNIASMRRWIGALALVMFVAILAADAVPLFRSFLYSRGAALSFGMGAGALLGLFCGVWAVGILCRDSLRVATAGEVESLMEE